MPKSTTNPEFRDLTRTPPWLFRAIDHMFIHTLDVAALPESALCREYITPEEDALASTTSWAARCPENAYGIKRVWCNPPYSNIAPWVEKAYHEAKHGVNTTFLLPADATCGWWPVGEKFDLITITGSKNAKGKHESGRIAFISAETGQELKAPTGGSVFLFVGPMHEKERRSYTSKQALMKAGGYYG